MYYKFVTRTSTEDTTRVLEIIDSDPPSWVTRSGNLNVGPTGENYALSQQWVRYQLVAEPVESPNSTVIKYYLDNSFGTLPPGLELSTDGVISGYVDVDHSISEPVLYSFTVIAATATETASENFMIWVLSSDIIRTKQHLIPASVTVNPYHIAYPLQWDKPSITQGIIHNSRVFIDLSAYGGGIDASNVRYSVAEGSSTSTQLPDSLYIDPVTGILQGYLEYSPTLPSVLFVHLIASRFDALTGLVVSSMRTYSIPIGN